MGRNKKYKEQPTERYLAELGAVEDIYELKSQYEMAKSGSIAGTQNQINTAGATSSEPIKRE